MTARRYLRSGFDGFRVPLRIMHGDLKNNRRLDGKAIAHDTLEIDFACLVDAPIEECPTSFEGLFNYADVYRHCLSLMGSELTATLESVLSSVMDAAKASATKQKVGLVSARVTARRHGLTRGHPHLMIEEGTWPSTGGGHGAGMGSIPLTVEVNHTALEEQWQLEHVDFRHESMKVDFMGRYRRVSTNDLDLEGLLNYAEVHHEITALQGFELTYSVEYLASRLMKRFIDSAAMQGVSLHYAELNLRRDGYIHATPVIGCLIATT